MTSCTDWRERIKAGESLIGRDPIYSDEADQSMSVFESLCVADISGCPTLGEVSRPWVKEFVRHVFGSYDQLSGIRAITEFFLMVGKKNSKSTLAAGIMLTALIRNWRESAEFLIVAPTIEVASNSYIPARDMVRKNPELSEMFQVQDHLRSITHLVTKATLKIIAADSETVSGKKATGVLIDELWLFGKKANAEGMLREATGGLASRPEGFVIYLTTQSDDPPAGVFRQKLDYARKVRDGKVTDSRFLPVIYEYPEDIIEKKLYRDPSTFHIPNPNLGASVDKSFLEREFAKAVETGEHSLINFAAKHLNVEIGLALQSNRWAGADFWERQNRDYVDLHYLIDRSDAIAVGIDGGGLDDMLALVAIGRDFETREWITWGHAWVNVSALARNKSEADRWKGFQEDGDLTITEDVSDDIDELLEYVTQIDASNVLDKIGVDPAGIGAILDGLSRIGIDEKRVVGISQGWRLTSAIKTAERKLADGSMIHGRSPLFSWNVGNAKVEPKGNAILVTKQASGNSKIDLVMALFDATAIMALNPAGIRSVYEEMAQERIAA